MAGGNAQPGGAPAAGGKEALGGLMVDEALGELDEVIAAGVETPRLARALHGGQDQPRERADDRNDDQHLDESEGAAGFVTVKPPVTHRKSSSFKGGSPLNHPATVVDRDALFCEFEVNR